ncbi:MAG: protein-glutamate O-methyltransferase CheR [Candidatus Desulfofervidaceae bacterium]|nr:protein-glutamate O-methyltransferase CheR [Candidatus Desulfofervidaceae bacterium]
MKENIQKPGIDDQTLELLLAKMEQKYGCDFSQYRRGTIKRRVYKRLVLSGVSDCQTYIHLLEQDPEEYKHLIQDLTIKVSCFFRDPYVFEFLARIVIPEIIKTKEQQHDRAIRIWSAGCAYGEEIYSVAILLIDYFEHKKKDIENFDIFLFGTDIDEEALAKARRGIYEEEAVLEVKKRFLDKYFVCKNGLYQLKEEVKRLVTFCQHDITSSKQISPPIGVVCNYDLILCRNLLIYFNVPLQKQVISNLSRSLNPGGYLVLGEAEFLFKEFEPLFDTLDLRAKVYQKKGER